METVSKAKGGLFASSLQELQDVYKNIQVEANTLIRENLGDTEIFNKLLKIAGNDGLIEIGHAFGAGDNGSGYYVAHLMLNLQNYKSNKGDIVYLVIKYVPSTDMEHEWDVKEFPEMSDCNFAKAYVLLAYMQVFISYHSCRMELFRLSERKYPACVSTVEPGGLSFI